jgi:cell division transport system permease protein
MARSKSTSRPRLADEGLLGRFSYFLVRVLRNIRQNILLNVLTVATITLALLIIGLFLLVFVNLEGAAASWSEKVQVTAYFDKELTPTEQLQLKARVLTIPGAARVAYVSKEEAAKRFRARLKGQESLLEGVTPDILPASLEIVLKRGFRSSEGVEGFVGQLKKVTGVTDVQYGEEWVKRFNTFMNFLRFVGALLGAFLVLAVVFIVSNTIKLTIYARQDELEVLALVGATRLFIKMPFLLEGILQGAVGALLSLVILAAVFFGFLHNAGTFLSFNLASAGLVFLPVTYLAGMLGGGILLGFMGSLTSLKRFINQAL